MTRDQAINSLRHSGECDEDEFTLSVCEGLYVQKVDDVIALCEALREVLSLVGENEEVQRIVGQALAEHGIDK